MASELDRLAAAYGILTRYRGVDGRLRHTPDASVTSLLDILGHSYAPLEGLPVPEESWPPPPRAPEGVRCYLPAFLGRGRVWGMTCQLYALRSRRNWGIGDFEDLARLGEAAAAWEADFLGINPLHALFTAAPERNSPFFPSDRGFLNPLYIAVDRISGFNAAEEDNAAALATLRAKPLLDYRAVSAIKLRALRRLWERQHPSVPDAFVERGGEELRRFALFEALSCFMVAEGFGAGWTSWPAAYDHPESQAVSRFAREYAGEVKYHIWLQWLAEEQLSAARRRLKSAGMRIGLYLDLAIGTAPDGAATWADRGLTVVGATVGAPPDHFNPAGQNWGLAPLSPTALLQSDLKPLRRAYDSVLRQAGALRIDHAMGVYRQFWIPQGAPPADGAYLLYPMDRILRALADASEQASAVIVGEDLGVVPAGFREAMTSMRIAGYRLFYFERGRHGGFKAPARWPRSALACLGSHDTPTFSGWWRGEDLRLRRALGLLERQDTATLDAERAEEKWQVLEALAAEGIEVRELGESEPPTVALHCFLARTPCRLMAVQLEDLLGVDKQVNLPGTIDEHPNWQQRMPCELEALEERPLFGATLAALAGLRPRRDSHRDSHQSAYSR
ncbi:4-alpha-glucanotransferase [Aquibaculum sediminis]|uniref:4-alpha-glucanotransferase n=1 Tax=Aquibaculum sediminis TaxID=3231907 RepID=UPI0034527AA3